MNHKYRVGDRVRIKTWVSIFGENIELEFDATIERCLAPADEFDDPWYTLTVYLPNGKTVSKMFVYEGRLK